MLSVNEGNPFKFDHAISWSINEAITVYKGLSRHNREVSSVFCAELVSLNASMGTNVHFSTRLFLPTESGAARQHAPKA